MRPARPGAAELIRSARRAGRPASGLTKVDLAAAAIRAVFEQRGELSAVVELRRLFPGVTDNRQARECVRMIASWKPPGPQRPARRSHS
jgi:hypothetical protein